MWPRRSVFWCVSEETLKVRSHKRFDAFARQFYIQRRNWILANSVRLLRYAGCESCIRSEIWQKIFNFLGEIATGRAHQRRDVVKHTRQLAMVRVGSAHAQWGRNDTRFRPSLKHSRKLLFLQLRKKSPDSLQSAFNNISRQADLKSRQTSRKSWKNCSSVRTTWPGSECKYLEEDWDRFTC